MKYLKKKTKHFSDKNHIAYSIVYKCCKKFFSHGNVSKCFPVIERIILFSFLLHRTLQDYPHARKA